MYRYTKERNINELRHNSMCGYENNRNSPVYRYTRTAPRNLRSIVISKISRHLQNTPLKKGLKFLERTFLQPIYFFFTLSAKKFTNNLPRDLQIFIPHKVKKSCSTSEVAVIFCYNCTRQIIMNDHNLSFV